MATIRVYLVDDHAMVREALAKTLMLTPHIEVVGQADGGLAFLSEAVQAAPDVVLMDLQMPGIDGIALCRRLKNILPNTRVVMLTMRDEAECVAQALQAGAVGYLLKSETFTNAVSAIEAVSAGRRYLSPAVREQVINGTLASKIEDDPLNSLSPREYELLCLLAQGRPSKVCAERMHVSSSTVSTFRSRVMQKLRLKSTAELIRYAIERGLIETP